MSFFYVFTDLLSLLFVFKRIHILFEDVKDICGNVYDWERRGQGSQLIEEAIIT